MGYSDEQLHIANKGSGYMHAFLRPYYRPFQSVNGPEKILTTYYHCVVHIDPKLTSLEISKPIFFNFCAGIFFLDLVYMFQNIDPLIITLNYAHTDDSNQNR